MTGIDWTDETWNPVTGCTRVSPGCAHCYIEHTPPFRMSGRRFARVGNVETTGIQFHPERLEQPLRWHTPRMVFVNSMSDLFHEEIPDEFIAEVFATMAFATQHTFQVLTKRPKRARELLSQPFERGSFSWITEDRVGARLSGDFPVEWPLPNLWLGVSIENSRYTYRADVLRETPAAVRFISAEPLLGSLFDAGPPMPTPEPAAWRKTPRRAALDLTDIDWVIAGGESGGRDARPMHPDWARELRDECLNWRNFKDGRWRQPAFFFKQWGSWEPDTGAGGDGVFLGADGRSLGAMGIDARPDALAEPVYRMRYVGRAPKSGGKLLDGREWCEYPPRRDLVPA